MKNLEVVWQSQGALRLHGHVEVQSGRQMCLTVHRWGALGGSAVVQLSRIQRVGDERIVPLPFGLQKLLGTQLKINGVLCGRMLRNRIAVVPGELDAWVLQTHIDVATSDELFVLAGQEAWAQVVNEGESV